ncbi:MAG: amidohydrolase family protein [Pseudomonadales bacterium]|nr:amidohydrolase family protein [Pseudomonadales bacterium]
MTDPNYHAGCAMHDIVIKNGIIIDGSGGERFAGDVAIDNGLISAVGKVTDGGRREIDAAGRLVTPGWVDVHTHYDGQATWDAIMAPSSWHGVTTVVMGNCGVGFAPVRPGDQNFLIELMEGVEDIPGSALAEGIDWQWETFPQYLDALERLPRTLDVATQVPHGAVRAYVMGERCNGDEAATPEEIEQMSQIVREGIEAGALGFSSSRTLLHKDVHGEYVPGTFAGSDEMLALGLAMKGLDHGVFEMVSDNLGDDDEWEWVKAFAKETGKKITLIATTPAAYVDGKIYRIAEEARENGMEILPQMAGRPTGVLHGLESNFHAFVGHPTYREKIAHLPHAEKVKAMRDPAIREQILGETSGIRSANLGPIDELMKRVFPLGENPNYEPDFEDSVAGIAAARGVSALEAMYDLLIAGEGKELFYQPLGGYVNYNLDAQRMLMQHPNVIMGLSDGGAHCGVIADAGMPTFIMTHWGRDRKKGDTLPLEFIVRSMTRRTAEAYGMNDRGLLAPGMIADVNVIDFESLRLFRPEAVYDLPTGGRRLVQRVVGYDYTIKSGKVTFEAGEHTGAFPGKLVRG